MPTKPKPKPKKPDPLDALDDLADFDLDDSADLDEEDDDGPDMDDGSIALDDGEDAAQAAEDENLAAATKAELEALQTDFQKRAKREDSRYFDAVDSEFWICLAFQTREQKEEFLRKLKLMSLGDKYLDGRAVAKKLGVTLTSREPVWRAAKGASKRLEKLT